jgi:hypothetical protein
MTTVDRFHHEPVVSMDVKAHVSGLLHGFLTCDEAVSEFLNDILNNPEQHTIFVAAMVVWRPFV